jgi:hypothetical protein
MEGGVMSSNKELARDKVGPDDLDRNPGIGQSPGSFATGEDPESIAGENTVVGDTENDSTANDGVPQEETGRTNK